MPTYEYFCPHNGQTVDVRHRMSEKLHTWGELCERANHDAGETPVETPIVRKISGGMLMLKKPPAPPSPAPSGGMPGGSCCGGGSCSH